MYPTSHIKLDSGVSILSIANNGLEAPIMTENGTAMFG